MSRDAATVLAELLNTADEAMRYGPTPSASRRYGELRNWLFLHADETANATEATSFDHANPVLRLLRSPSLEGFLSADADRLRALVLPGTAASV